MDKKRHLTGEQKPSAPNRVAIYTRVSSTMQVEDGFSLDAQVKACRKFAEQKEWQVVEVYEEPGILGKDTNRPVFWRMIRDARSGYFNVILTHKLDRFSRSILDVLTYLRDLNEWGVAYVSATEHFDFSTPMGKMQLHIMAALAQWYLDNLSQEITKGKKARAEAGYWNGNPPFGYRKKDKRTIVVDAEEAEGVRLAFRLAATGAYSYVDIAKELNKAGYRTHGNGRYAQGHFTKHTTRDLLSNRFYVGYAKYRKSAGRRQFDYLKGQHPAIIKEALWDKAQQALRIHFVRPNGTKIKDKTYPLTGLMICANCKSPFRGQSSRQYTYYLDSGHIYGKDCPFTLIPAQPLEQQLIDFFAKIKITDQVKAEVLARLAKAQNAGKHARQRARLTAQLERSRKLFLVGDTTESDYLKEKSQIELELGRLQPSAQPQGDIEAAARLLSTFGSTLAKATPEELKLFFRTVLEEVYVKNRKIVSIKPKPNFYDLLCKSGVRPNGFEPSQPFGH